MEEMLLNAIGALALAAVQASVTVAVGRLFEGRPPVASRNAKHLAKEGTGACDAGHAWADFLRDLAVWAAVAAGIVLTSPIPISSFVRMKETVGVVRATGVMLLSTSVAAQVSRLVLQRGARP